MIKAALLLSLLFASFVPCLAQTDAATKLYPVMIKGKYGYINAEGKVVIQPQFTSARPFHDGLAVAGINGKNISATTGHYDYIVNEEGYIDQNGKFVIPPGKFNFPQHFSEGLASVRIEGPDFDRSYGYIDTTGKVVIPAQFRAAGNFANGTADVRMADGNYGLIDKTGKFIVPPEYDGTLPVIEGIGIGYKIKNKKESPFDQVLSDIETFFFDVSGKIIARPKFVVFGIFGDGLVLAVTEKGQGFVNKAGEMAIEPKFEKVRGFSEGLSPARVNKKWGYIDRTGNFAIPAIYDEAYMFSDGLARVGMEWANTTFIDRSGKIALYVPGWEVFDFEDGIAYARKSDGTTGYINKTGKFIWQGK